jgi:co-chaperonin GroES (HSP10)
MGTNFDVKHITVQAIRDDVLVSDMDMGEQTTAAGIVIQSDDGKSHGVKPRWARVYKVGPKQMTIKEG